MANAKKMKIWLMAGVLMLVCAGPGIAKGLPERENDFLIQEVKLKEKIELTDAQEGFVGIKGKIWTIEPDGKWYVSTFTNDRISEPYQEGHLSGDMLKSLGTILSEKGFSQLPESFGRTKEVNRHLITISFGVQKSTLILNTKEQLQEARFSDQDPDAANVRSFRAIVEFIESLGEH